MKQWLTVVTSLLVFYSFSQNSVSGKLLTTSNTPIIGALVQWENSNRGTQSNFEGKFSLKRQAGDSILLISADGFVPKKILIKNELSIEIKLSSKTESLGTVEIKVETPSTFTSTYSTVKMETLTEQELAKAACCNLAESFETNPSVDVSFTDAVTGTKQIQLLGLSGTYTMLTNGNVNVLNGNSIVTGIEHIPGQWLKSIQLIKGAGSVANGHSSITGQINTEWKKPDSKTDLFLNLYANAGTKVEFNGIKNFRLSKKTSTGLYIHANRAFTPMDRNGDGFSDNQIGDKIVAMNQWHTQRGNIRSQFGIKGHYLSATSGQFSEFNNPNDKLYQIKNRQDRIELWDKIGYVFKGRKATSIGLQLNALTQSTDIKYGDNLLSTVESRLYSNLLFETYISNTNNKVKVGLSNQLQEVNNVYYGTQTLLDDRRDALVGAFAEATLTKSEKLSVVPGVRVDYSAIENRIYPTGRFHLRYAPTSKNVLRASGGYGWKRANPLAENIGAFASSRAHSINSIDKLPNEEAINMGWNYLRKFELFYRDGSLSIDNYWTRFFSKTILDYEASNNSLIFDNTQNASALSVIAQLKYELVKNLYSTWAYRWYDVRAEYASRGIKPYLFTPKNRAFVNLEYRFRDWKLDATLNWTGKSRIPNVGDLTKDEWSEDFITLNGQLSLDKEQWTVYFGGENLTNYQQPTPILNANNPFEQGFDASMVWGPVFGMKLYAGIKLNVFRKEKGHR